MDVERASGRAASHHQLHPTTILVSEILSGLGLRVFVIGARNIIMHGIDLGRETRDWDLTIDKPFTPELRDAITRALRSHGFKVQWRKWGLLVEDDTHIDINYAPLILDEEFIRRSVAVSGSILLASIEDVLVLKLMSGERRDIEDLKKVIRQAWNRIDRAYLRRRVEQAGLARELEKILRRVGARP